MKRNMQRTLSAMIYKVKVQDSSFGTTRYYKTTATIQNGVTYLENQDGDYVPIDPVTQGITTIWANAPARGYVSIEPTSSLKAAIEKLNKYIEINS